MLKQDLTRSVSPKLLLFFSAALSLHCESGPAPQADMGSISALPMRESPNEVMTTERDVEQPTPDEQIISSVIERSGRGEVGPLDCAGDLCPAARITYLEFPRLPEESAARGCRLLGENNGTGIGSVLAIAGGSVNLNSYLQPNEEGEIEFLLINHITWPSGLTGAEAGPLRATLYNGVGDAQSLSIVRGNPTVKPYSERLSVERGLYYSPPSEVTMRLPIKDLTAPVRLSHAELSAYLTLDSVGFNLTEGILAGYLTQDAILGIIESLKADCQSDPNISNCRNLSSVLSGDLDNNLEFLVQLMGGYDALIDDQGVLHTCEDAPQCNAVGVCLFFEMESVQIVGVQE